MNTPGDERWLAGIRDHAARLAFPEWEPRPDDWTHLHTGVSDDGTPYTEVSVYRAGDGGGHVRICYSRFAGNELAAFWTRLMREIAE
ncbi:hypothetical protein [Nonomuraea sp. SBT364]|uniref:hypothetical protein n=1 Tax=Nonomuraea sp. SBT364 TaxID=1580530 RepID=UPI00066E9435|nr:hypothetical protein [Nonomuraea sp. SBT364]